VAGVGIFSISRKKITAQIIYKENRKKESITNSEGGNIYLEIEFKDIENKNKEELIFEVSMYTHTEDLSRYYELDKFSEIIVDGLHIKNGITWKRSGGGHHVSGILKIKNYYNGSKIVDNNTKEIKLKFKNIGDVKERIHLYKI
jgi:hypothetical protein